MRKRFLFLWVAGAVLLLALGYGCGGSSVAMFGTGGGASGAGAGATTATSSTGCLFGCGGNLPSGGSGGNNENQGTIIITPSNATLAVVDANIPTQVYTATLNGQDVTGQVSWIYDRPDVGDIAAAGAKFTPTGLVGGKGNLTAELAKSTGATTVTVTIKKTVDAVGVTPAQIAAFGAPAGGPDAQLNISYPYNQVVFPLAVLAPEIQWSGGAAADVYQLHVTEKFCDYTGYFTGPAPSRFTLADADWATIENSGSGAQSDPVTVSLERMSNAVAYQPVVQTWHVAQGKLQGSVYYWELPDACVNGDANGRILRIKPNSAMVDEFFQPGTCFGCHTVSRDGQKLAAEFTNGNGPLYTVNLAANPVAYGDLNPGHPAGGSSNYIFSAFNDKGDKLLACDNTAFNPAVATLSILDSVGGSVLAPGVLGTGCGEPAWSPDGKKIAGICNLSGGGWVFDASSGDVTVADVAADGVTVSNSQVIVQGASGAGRPAYPSFSPGAEWLAFGRPTVGSRSTGNGSLWIVAPDGTGLKELVSADNDTKSFNPVFAPLRAGGYYWIVFITRRDYGNEIVGADRQQLWITAIDDPPSAGDPSHPPFYVRGQESCGKSENAYYALDPCKALGASCMSGVDCCNGQCVKDPMTMMYVCGEPPDAGACSGDGNSCVVSADCCNAPVVGCIDGFCQAPPLK